MLEYIKSNLQFYVLLIIWVVFGILAPPVSYIIVPLSIILLWKKERYADVLIAFLAILIFSDSFYLPFAKNIKPYVLLLLSLLFFYNRKLFYPSSQIASPFIIFLVYSSILLIKSETFVISFQKTLSYILLFLTIPNYVMMLYRRDGPEFFKKLVLFSVALLYIGLIMMYIFPDVAISHGTRFRGIFGNPNGVAMYCVFIYIIIGILDEYYPELISRREKLVMYISIFASILLSGSRSSIMCVLIFYIFSKIQKKSPILSIIILIMIIIAFQVIAANLVEIVKTFGLEQYFRLDTLKEGSGRIFAWGFAWEEIQKNFFFGKGFDYNQYLFFIPHIQSKLNMLNHQGDVHNIYLGFWLDVGLVGLVLYFFAFVYTFIKADKNTHLAFPIMFSMLFMGNYEPWLIASLNPYTIQFLIIATLMINCKELPDKWGMPLKTIHEK